MRKIIALSLQDDSEYCPSVPEDSTSNTQNDKFTLPEPGMEDLIGNVVPINTVIGVAIACQEMDKKSGEDAPQRAEMGQVLEDEQRVEDIRHMRDIVEEDKRLRNEKEQAHLEELGWRRAEEELARREQVELIRIELERRMEEFVRVEAARELEEERPRVEIEDQKRFLEERTEQEHVEQNMHSPE